MCGGCHHMAIVVVNRLGIKKQESHIIYVQKNVTT
jgi:hypothetical protein